MFDPYIIIVSAANVCEEPCIVFIIAYEQTQIKQESATFFFSSFFNLPLSTCVEAVKRRSILRYRADILRYRADIFRYRADILNGLIFFGTCRLIYYNWTRLPL